MFSASAAPSICSSPARFCCSASELGFPLKIHADEFENLGGASLAVELGAVSADHLVKTSAADIAALGSSATAAVSLPCTPFGLAESEYTPAKAILAAGGCWRWRPTSTPAQPGAETCSLRLPWPAAI